MKNIPIPYENLKEVNAPYYSQLYSNAKSIIEGGWYVLGNEVENFEKEFSILHNGSFCLGVASGLDALILGLSVFNFPAGSKVLVPSNTYIASILAILRSNLIPVLVEPDPHTYNITVESLEKNYTSSCVAILPVHLYGRLCPMDEIVQFAKSRNLVIVEDCAQSHFAEINHQKAGTFGDIGAFSFYPTKNLGALGDAGAILCKDEDIYMRLKALRNYGSHQKYHNKFIGWNSRLDEIQASFLLTKIMDYQKVINHKNMISKMYFSELIEYNIQLPCTAQKDCVWHIYNILSNDRDKLKHELQKVGVATEIHYPIPPHQQVAYKGLFAGKYPISEKIHNQTLSLPISTCHSIQQIEIVIERLKKVFKML